MDKVVFLDRDGTINVEKNYLHRIEDFEFIPGAEEAIALLNKNGYRVVVVTNQAGVARGYYEETDVMNLHAYINEQLKKYDAHIDDFRYCPHHPEHGIGIYKTNCECRKPNTGMLAAVVDGLSLDYAHCWMIGDNTGDINAGKNFGINTILVLTGYGEQIKDSVYADYIAKDILEAVHILLKKD